MASLKSVAVVLGTAICASPALAQASDDGTLPGWAMTGFLILIYLLPSIIAAKRHHNNEGAIVALNFLLGWTLLGWVAALVWAFTDNTRLPRA